MNSATIVIKEDAQDTLANFPYQPGQYLEAGEDLNPDGDGVMVTINLADRIDLTAAQEQYLNTSDDVLSYNVDQSIEDRISE